MAPLFEERQKIVSQIPDFWPLVIEQAPSEIDQYIQPSDSALILKSLKALSVSTFEIEPANESSGGDPRNIAIRFEFKENEYFEDTVLEKKFWWRKSRNGWAGLVSEPVPIKWKQGKDLTGGLLDMVVKVWKLEKKQAQECNGEGEKLKDELLAQQKALRQKIESTGMGGLSFFAWFGFIGQKISAEESKEAEVKERADLKAKMEAARDHSTEVETAASPEVEDDNEELEVDLEIFPTGDDLATAIAQDLWPDATKYFSMAFDIAHVFHDDLFNTALITNMQRSSSARARFSFRRRLRVRRRPQRAVLETHR